MAIDLERARAETPGCRERVDFNNAGASLMPSPVFGGFVVGLDAGSDESSPVRFLPVLVGVGAFDTGANVCVAFATTKGAAGIVAVLSALYPIVTVVLARLVLDERLSVARRAGGVTALAGAALVAAG
jgi:drug/metabolite transporter (DMT)-like permease